MLTRRKVLDTLAVAAVAASVLILPQASGAAAQPADEFIRAMGQEAVDSLTGAELDNAQREARFRDILNRSFDMEAIARFTLGRYWRVASGEQKAEYVRLFEDFVVQAYAARFREYSGESFKVGQVRDIGENEKLVASEIVRAGMPTVAVHWRVRAASDIKVIDVVVEGVSMGITQRDEFAAVIRNNGGKVEGLLSALRRKTGRQ